MEIQKFIKKMPKIELHRHLSGALSSAAMFEIAAENGFPVESGSLDDFKKLTSMYGEKPDFHTFLDKFISRARFITDKSCVDRIVKNVVKEAAEDNIIHLELRFSADHFSRHMGFDMGEIAEQIISTSSEEADKQGISIVFIMTLSRHIPYDINNRMADICLNSELSRYFAGIDIAGDEASYSLDELKPLIKKGVKAGKKITIHAGEAGPASNVSEAVDAGASRIGHGINSFFNPEILEKAIQQSITYEVCPTSNIQTGTVKSIQKLDIKRVMDSGALITINTDDPGVSDTDLSAEYTIIQDVFQLSQSDINDLLLNSVSGAFIPEQGRNSLKNKINDYFINTDYSF